jgi:hypothetical protein
MHLELLLLFLIKMGRQLVFMMKQKNLIMAQEVQSKSRASFLCQQGVSWL